MAYATKYRVFFSDFDGAEYRADLKFDGYAGAVIELTGAGNTGSVSFGNADDKFQTLSGSGCSISFHNNGYDLSDLFAVGIYDIQMVIERRWQTSAYWHSIWSGYVNPEIYDEDYTWSRGDVTVTGNDGIASIKREKYFLGAQQAQNGTVYKPWSYGIATQRSVIATCLSKVSIGRIYTIVDITGSISNFANMSVNLANYTDEDGESMTRYEVLESILKPWGLRCLVFGYACWIYDPCLLATNSATVSYLAYDSTFTAVPAENGTYTKDTDLSAVSPIIKFMDASQAMSTVGGYKTLISNYSAYPSPSAIIPTDPKDLPSIPNTLAWNHIRQRNLADETQGYIHFRRFDDINGEYSDYGIGTYTQAVIGVMNTNNYTNDETATEKYAIFGYDSIYHESFPTRTDPEEFAFGFTGGWIPKSGDTLTIRFDVLLDGEIKDNTYSSSNINSIRIPYRLRVGSKYAAISGSTITWENFPVTNFTRAKNSSGASCYGSTSTAEIIVYGIETAGDFYLEFGREFTAHNPYSGDVYFVSTYTYISFNNFEVIINGYEINDEDAEFKAESGTDFINDKTIEINHSSTRDQGLLDRGTFINTNGEHETYFNRISYPYSGSMALPLAQGILNNYKTPFRKLTATIRGIQLLRNTSSITVGTDNVPKSISGLLCPMMVIQDTANLGTKRFMFTGGTFNLIDKSVTGTWQEIFDANYSITEV